MDNTENHIEIPIDDAGQYLVLIDKEDYEKVRDVDWVLNATIRRGKPPVYQVMGRVKDPDTGKFVRRTLARHLMGTKAPHLVVDHKNGNTLDNRRRNLREISKSENAQNSRHFSGTSHYKGVTKTTRRGKRYLARIKPPHQDRLFLGYFENAVDAARAYDKAAAKYFGEFAVLNFPVYPEDGSDAT